MSDEHDVIDFDEPTALALAASAGSATPRPDVKRRLMLRLFGAATPAGFEVVRADDDRWLPHPVSGIRMKILALNSARGYATLLLDVAPGTRFPPHHHGGAEECYVVSGTLFSGGQKLAAGDFIHADADTDHAELWTEEGCRVILVVPPEEHLAPHLLADR
jgi:anti-sigma factor ChrR (cupin superfamily)